MRSCRKCCAPAQILKKRTTRALIPINIWPAIDLRSLYPARFPLRVKPGGGFEVFKQIHRLRGLYDFV